MPRAKSREAVASFFAAGVASIQSQNANCPRATPNADASILATERKDSRGLTPDAELLTAKSTPLFISNSFDHVSPRRYADLVLSRFIRAS
jgi:hypothetical protein